MKRFFGEERGFVLTFALIALPVFIAYALIIIDIGRGNNAQADLQAAADAVALAGAGELDGGVDALERAREAMGNLSNTVSMLGLSESTKHISLVYANEDGNEFTVVFLSDIPELDSTPIDQSWLNANFTEDPAEAKFVFVQAQSEDLMTAVFNPINLLHETVPIAAQAVAQSHSAACNIPPLYICNPFEYDDDGNYVGDELQERFAAGDLHGRIIKLHPKGNVTAAPGNFGFLSIDGTSSADAIRDFFAGATVPKCFSSDTVDTKPGAASSIAQGINTRFDIYEGSFSNWNNNTKSFQIAPAANVRKGIRPDVNGAGTIDDCVAPNPASGNVGDDNINDLASGFNANGVDDEVYGLPDNETMSAPGTLVAGAAIGSGDWPIETYWLENHGSSTVPVDIPNSFEDKGAALPSRYDVYKYELDNGLVGDRHPGDGTDASESGLPLCAASKTAKGIVPIAEPDRRLMVAAIIDCKSQEDEGGGTNTYRVNSFAQIFMVRPMVSTAPSADPTIDVEIVDITGYGGNGTLEEFVRVEVELVR